MTCLRVLAKCKEHTQVRIIWGEFNEEPVCKGQAIGNRAKDGAESPQGAGGGGGTLPGPDLRG